MSDTTNTEASSLLPVTSKAGSSKFDAAMSSGSKVSTFLFVSQACLVLLLLNGTTVSDEEFSTKEYIAFRDIMAMLLLGFGYLMTFLKSYGLGAVGFTMMLTVYSMQLNVVVELAMRYLYGSTGPETSWPMPVTMATLIDAEFSAATLLITFGAVIGSATPLQMLVLATSESIFYAFNKVFLVLGYVGAEDVGGSMTIHMFGAYFGLAASYALGPPKGGKGEPEADKISDIFALVGTTILWVFWPSFVGATETGVGENEKQCVLNTIFALLASTGAAFWASHRFTGSKFDPVHIANSTLAGGVAIGSSGRLDIGPGGAALLGAIAGTVSVLGYVYSSPFLESKLGVYDTCGVGNLHGWPSLIGGLMSIAFVAIDADATFLLSSSVPTVQMIRQLGGVFSTLLVAKASGYLTGFFASKLKDDETFNYEDDVWWHAEYFEEKEEETKTFDM